MVWCSVRITVHLSMCRAMRGRCSQISMSGQEVRICPCGERYSFGASGFMSRMSIWLGPPHWNRKMTDLALGAIVSFFAVASEARNSLGMVRPSSPMPPARSSVRRAMAVSRKPWQDGFFIVST